MNVHIKLCELWRIFCNYGLHLSAILLKWGLDTTDIASTNHLRKRFIVHLVKQIRFNLLKAQINNI